MMTCGVILSGAKEACLRMASFASLRMTSLLVAGVVVLSPTHTSLALFSVPSSPATRDEEGVAEVIAKFKEKDPGLADVFASAAGYAVYPTIGKGGIGIGGARGKGWVYQRGHVIGRSTMNQVTIGFQFGGQVYSEVVFFKTTAALDNFKLGHLKLDAQASAIALTARASADLAYREGVAIVTMAKGGLMYEASVGGQKFSFKPVGK
jgi:lipid-binding SYLF domain-containing protein